MFKIFVCDFVPGATTPGIKVITKLDGAPREAWYRADIEISLFFAKASYLYKRCGKKPLNSSKFLSQYLLARSISLDQRFHYPIQC